ncbi:helix-turn-helix domain-containing protein [Rhodococcoides kyotonense]|uniref:Helix-turn-helix domain-containing protein n=1 Tax=Rhodococcoides kyotonense TaxID=398843 RepID=A0A239FKT8_9NOCA|nr:helix-turn-helix domain-containing protein [Rhodococcus kyotonensis]SNS57530.1 Helix-turn-helix domain-containing protein [Rhodococcus kyotonensis]
MTMSLDQATDTAADVHSDSGYFAMIPEWVLFAPISAHATRLYCVLRRYADKASGLCHPSRQTLAKHCQTSVKTIDRAVQELMEIGAIVRFSRYVNDSGQVSRSQSDEFREQTSNGYIVRSIAPNLTRGRDKNDPTPQGNPDATPGTKTTHKPESLKPEPSFEPENTRDELALIDQPDTAPTPKSFSKKQIEEHFDVWYQAYPRKVARPDALKAYTKAVKAAGPEKLLAAATALAAEKRDKQFYPYPATWLNKGHWDSDDQGNTSQLTATGIELWLRDCWQRGDFRSVEDRSGLAYPQPDIPADLPDRDAVATWLLGYRRNWIEAKRTQITAAVTRREGISA